MQSQCAASNEVGKRDGHSHRCVLGSRKRFDWVHVSFHVYLTVFISYTISSPFFSFWIYNILYYLCFIFFLLENHHEY